MRIGKQKEKYPPFSGFDLVMANVYTAKALKASGIISYKIL
jgi:hypothetical protein